MDSAHRRLFAACDKVLVVVNADNGKVVASRRSAAILTAMATIRHRAGFRRPAVKGLFPSSTRIQPDKYSAVGNVNTQFGTRTMTLDPKTHHVFTETADFKAAPPRRRTIRARVPSQSTAPS